MAGCKWECDIARKEGRGGERKRMSDSMTHFSALTCQFNAQSRSGPPHIHFTYLPSSIGRLSTIAFS